MDNQRQDITFDLHTRLADTLDGPMDREPQGRTGVIHTPHGDIQTSTLR